MHFGCDTLHTTCLFVSTIISKLCTSQIHAESKLLLSEVSSKGLKKSFRGGQRLRLSIESSRCSITEEGSLQLSVANEAIVTGDFASGLSLIR